MGRISQKMVVPFLSGTVIGTLLFVQTSVNASPNTAHLLNAWRALQTDFEKVRSAVSSNNVQAAESGFAAYSRDCVYLATFETSFSSTINSDIFTIAVTGNAWAWIGFITVSTNSSPSNFTTESTRLAGAINKFNKVLRAIGL